MGIAAWHWMCVRKLNTVRFQILRDTMKLNTIFAALEMLNCICNAAIYLSKFSSVETGEGETSHLQKSLQIKNQ